MALGNESSAESGGGIPGRWKDHPIQMWLCRSSRSGVTLSRAEESQSGDFPYAVSVWSSRTPCRVYSG